jgi:hypothetical protein
MDSKLLFILGFVLLAGLALAKSGKFLEKTEKFYSVIVYISLLAVKLSQ